MIRLPKPITEALEDTGLPWSVENGGRHAKIKLAGRLVASLGRASRSTSDLRPTLNVISQIRRAAREVSQALGGE